MRYPKEVYDIREDVTRNNKKRYDEWHTRLLEKCEEINPSYWFLFLAERNKVAKQAEKEIGGWR